jgi:methylmalonyl-CoA mutase N-terminal domain/subunit
MDSRRRGQKGKVWIRSKVKAGHGEWEEGIEDRERSGGPENTETLTGEELLSLAPAVLALAALDEAITGDENVMPYIVDAVKAYATMGEIMNLFERHYGSYQESIGLAG